MSNNKDFKVTIGIQPTVYHEGLGTVVSGSEGYSISGASYDSKSFDTQSETTVIYSVDFKTDGTKMYALDLVGDVIYQYSLSTPWDVSTASYDSKSLSAASQDTTTRAARLSLDGTKVYVMGDTNNTIYQYTLSTAWDLSTGSYASKSFSVASQSTTPMDIAFRTDGTAFYLASQVGSVADAVVQYTLSTAWDISTASYSSKSLSVNSQETSITCCDISEDGYTVIAAGNVTDTVFKYTLSTAWDLSTGSYSGESFSLTGQMTDVNDVKFGNSGNKLYAVKGSPDTIYQYSTALITAELDLSTGSVFEVTPTSDIQVTLSNPADSGTVSGATLLLDGVAEGYDLSGAAYDSVELSVSSQTTGPHGIKINNDGTKLYLINSTGDAVLQYSMSTANDLSTASYDSVSFSVTSQAGLPRDLAFNSDGTKMYVVGSVTDSVFQYSLSTAFDVSTASYDSVSLSVSSQETNPFGMTLNDDGTKLYIVGSTSDAVSQYSMSTAYDLSTASYDSVSLSISAQDTNPRGIAFNDSGTKMYIAGNTSDAVLQYSLSTAYDLSTASYDSVSFSTSSQDTSPFGIAFSSDGAKMFIAGDGNDKIYQYTTGSAYTVTYDSAIQFGGGTAPDSPLANETDVLAFSTRDGGSTYQGVLAIDGAK